MGDGEGGNGAEAGKVVTPVRCMASGRYTRTDRREKLKMKTPASPHEEYIAGVYGRHYFAGPSGDAKLIRGIDPQKFRAGEMPFEWENGNLCISHGVVMGEGNDVRCPKCGGWLFEKYGKTEAGKQKLRCLEPTCRRQFTLGSDHLLNPDKKKIIEALLANGIAPKKIREAFPKDVSLRWLFGLRRKIK